MLLGLSAIGGAAANVVVVLNSGDASISVIDQATRKELRRFDVGKEPHHLMATPDGRSLIVAGAGSNELLFLDPSTGALQRRVRGIADPYQIGFSPDRNWFVANALRLNRVDLYRVQGDEFVRVKQIAAAKTPSHLAFSADSRWVFVTLQDSDEIGAIDLVEQKLAWKLAVGETPAGIWMTPDDRYLLVAAMGKDYVEVIDWRTRTSVKKIVTGKGAHNFRPAGDGRHLYVSNRVSNTISVVDMNSLEKVYDIAVPGGPDCMDISADGRTLWVTQRWLKRVGIVDLDKRALVDAVAVGKSPHGIFLANNAAWR